MDRLLRLVSRTGFRRAMAGEHWAWFVLAGAAVLLRRARRPEDALVLSRRLEPGERYLVTLRAPGSEGTSAVPGEPGD
ncbi:MAG: hypothetical protein ACYCU7_10815 [Acidimicrobiales bacterium]